MGRLLRAVLTTLLFLGYPLIIFLLLSNNLAWLGSSLVVVFVLWKVHNRSDWLWWAAAILIGVTAVFYVFGAGAVAKLSPLMIHSALFYLFWNSLKTTPLIEQFARLDFPEIPPHILVYTRQLTAVWSGFFALNVIGGIGLALWSDDSTWALYNGVIIYILIGTLIIGEYIWRKIRFPGLEVPPMKQSIRNIMTHGHKIWGSERNGET